MTGKKSFKKKKRRRKKLGELPGESEDTERQLYCCQNLRYEGAVSI